MLRATKYTLVSQLSIRYSAYTGKSTDNFKQHPPPGSQGVSPPSYTSLISLTLGGSTYSPLRAKKKPIPKKV